MLAHSQSKIRLECIKNQENLVCTMIIQKS